MNELAMVAAESVGSRECVNIEKLPDGMFNKTFQFTMANGAEVVGKVPNPNAGQAHFTTASEVATMDFVRNVLGTPVPRVLAWSSKAGENAVGAEYIIMEKVAGVQLSHVWYNMGIEDRFEVVKAISGYQKSWLSTSFTKYGSLYYPCDTDYQKECVLIKSDGTHTKQPHFVIGPSTGRDQADHGRVSIDFDRGPWDDAFQYRRAVGFREMTSVQSIAELPQSPLSLYGPGTYYPTRAKKLAALNSYLRLVRYLLPTDKSVMASFLWHSDLHTENIFVNPERPTQILGIIDWQSTELLPLFEHARQPYFLDYDGPSVEGLEPPTLPDNINELSSAKQLEATRLYMSMSLSALYRNLTYRDNPVLYEAMEFRQTKSFEMLLLAQNLFVDGEALYQTSALDLEKEWPDMPGVQAFGNPPFPVQLSASEIRSLERDVSSTIRGMELLAHLKNSLGELWPEKGVVRHDQYDDAKTLLNQAKAEIHNVVKSILK
ncbi:Aminoglycoside phosphotransferase [Penicillium italicum]|uniref:Aminoglycoside phosphotransferase n=1 Tax=Penicillium italicum TaxID=40296 RepID=A0A0A2L211_PENIT|nr:Aminoglycoside phosphotransferase [Penicillium italicum]